MTKLCISLSIPVWEYEPSISFMICPLMVNNGSVVIGVKKKKKESYFVIVVSRNLRY